MSPRSDFHAVLVFSSPKILLNLQFQNILKTNIEEAKSLMSKICGFNKIFFEEHLGIRWQPPDLKILADSNLDALQGLKIPQVRPFKKASDNDGKQHKGKVFFEKKNWKMFQRVFETISESMGYLMDKDLPEVLALREMSPEERNLVHIDNVFSVSYAMGAH